MQMEPVIPTDPETLDQLDQRAFLDHLKEWSVRYREKKMTNDEIAEFALATTKVVETWRCDPSTCAYRPMRMKDRVLLALRVMESVRNTNDEERLSAWEKACVQHYANQGVTAIVRITGRHAGTLISYMKRHGIHAPTVNKPWTDEDDIFIRKNYKRMTAKEMAFSLGREPQQVAWRKVKLGLKRYERNDA